MRKLVAVVMVVVVVALVAWGCDTRRAQIEKSKQKFKVTSEIAKEQSANQQTVLQSAEKYKNDFGQYPQSLEELKAQGYDVPAPSEGWKWDYQLNPAVGPQLMPVPE